MGKLSLATGLVALLGAVSCGRGPTGPESGDIKVETKAVTEEFSRSYDTPDRPFTEETKARLESIKVDFPTLDFALYTIPFEGQDFILSVRANGTIEVQLTRTTVYSNNPLTGNVYPTETTEREPVTPIDHLQQRLDWATTGSTDPDYGRRVGGNTMFYQVDVPDAPETPELTARLEKINNKPINGDISFTPVYLTDRENRIVFNNGQRMINAIQINPLVTPGAGYSGMGYEALWAATGDDRWNDPQVRYPNLEVINYETIPADSTGN